MAIKPMWFLFGMKELPEGFNPYSKSAEFIEYSVKKKTGIHILMRLQAPTQEGVDDTASDLEYGHGVLVERL